MDLFLSSIFIKNRIIGVILIEPWGIERCSGFFTWNTLPWLHEKSLKLLFLTKVNLCFPYSKFNKGHKIIISVPKFISDRIENFFISKDFKFAEFIKYFADLNSKKVNFNVFMLTHQQKLSQLEEKQCSNWLNLEGLVAMFHMLKIRFTKF